MSKRIDIVRNIDNVLGDILNSGDQLLELAEQIEDKEWKKEVLKCTVVLALEVRDMNIFLIKNLAKYVGKDMDDKAFFKIMSQLKDKENWKALCHNCHKIYKIEEGTKIWKCICGLLCEIKKDKNGS